MHQFHRLFSHTKDICKILTWLPSVLAPNTGGVGNVNDFQEVSRYVLETVRDKTTTVQH